MKTRKTFFTKTTKRIALWNGIIIFILYLLFNVFSIFLLEYQLIKSLDSTIAHELEHILHSFVVEDDSIYFRNPSEFEESDLVEITETPFFLQVFKSDGTIIFHSLNIHKFTPIPVFIPEINDDYVYINLTSEGTDLRVGYSKLYDLSGKFYGYIQLSTFISATADIENEIILFNLISFPVFVIIIVIISVFLAKKSYDPLNKIMDIANTISTTNLDQRLDYNTDKRDELGRLQITLNSLFERLEKQVNQISNFADNASHQLMTPLSVINTELDYILKQKELNKESKDSIRVLKEQTERLIHIIKTLLFIAKDRSDITYQRSIFNLSNVVKREIEKNPAQNKIISQIEEDVFVKGNKDNFLLVINNLIDNALKYSAEDGIITVRIYIDDEEVKLSVEDTGIGISDKDKQNIFERFYRTERSINSTAGGFGLGLSLVKSVVDSMAGTITVEDNLPRGTKFVITFPVLQMQ